MRSLAKVVTVLLLLFFLYAAPSTAEIKSVKIRSNDFGWFLLDYFKFTNTGNVSITVSDISVTSLPVTSNIARPDPSLFGFFLLSDEAEYRFYSEYGRWCRLHSKFITLLFTFKDLANYSSFNKSYPVTYPDGYSLYFANCNQLSHVTMDVRTELYNIVNGATKDYLSPGITNLPWLYFIFSLIYLCFLGFWMIACFKNRTSIYPVHLLMGVLLAMNTISLFSEAEVLHSLKVTGTRENGWAILLYIFQFITPTLFYTVIAVVFDGFSFVKHKAKMFLMLVIPLQILATVLSHKLTGQVVSNGDSMTPVLVMLHIVLSIAIIWPIASSLSSVGDPDEDEEDCFCFALVLGVYLLVEIIVGVANNLYINYDLKYYAGEETLILLFYIIMFSMVIPNEKRVYFEKLNTEETTVKEVAFEKRVYFEKLDTEETTVKEVEIEEL